jgi:ubiquinone/menaquinone biosynthesis C-methylase UbiE
VWFWEHYEEAANQVTEFLAGDGVSLTGLRVADVGSGDGIIDLAIARGSAPELLTGYDLNLTDAAHLSRLSAREGLPAELPACLRFERSEPTVIPAPDASYDAVITWSAFEHIGDPVSVLREIRRIMRPQGLLFLQLWPFYHSDAGGHLWDWYSESFPHLTRTEDQVLREVRASGARSPEWTEYMLDEFRHLNRVTVDELQTSLLAAGLAVRKLELLTSPVHIPLELMRYPLSTLGISGVKLLASPL